jgi:hypothetical protein
MKVGPWAVRALLAAASAWTLVGCSSTVSGVAVPGPGALNGAAPRAALTPSSVPFWALPMLLVPPDEVASTTGTDALAVDPSIHGLLDTPAPAELVDKDCAGAWAPARRLVYGNTAMIGVQTQGLKNSQGPLTQAVVQSVIAFPDARLAKNVLADQAAQWSACSGRTITVKQADPPPQRWALGQLTRKGATLTLTQQLEGGAGMGCQRALAARSNIVIDADVCRVDVTSQAADLLNAIAARIPQ